MTTQQAKISQSNSKLGKVMNISLPPVITCRSDAPCKKECYALKAYRQYPSTRTAWHRNLYMFHDNPTNYFDVITRQIQAKRTPPRFFRWHVSGDIVNATYFNGMIHVAEECPDTIFLAFTKQYEIVNNIAITIPDNLTIIFSAWPGLELENPHGYPVAWFDDGTDNRIPSDHIECPGNCETCGMCFQINKLNKDVVFKKH